MSHLATFLLVCCLFCLSGLCNGMIDVLNKHFQNSLQVSKAQSALVQGFWYAGYFLLALPAGMFARRYGYRGGILFGLSVIAVGCVCFVPVTKIVASQMVVFSFFLLALGLVACGFTFIETIANPYATVLGAPEAGVARINLAQSCNAVGWIFGPLLGGSFILSKTEQVNTSNAALYLPYLIVAGIVTVLIVAFALAPVPDLHAARGSPRGGEWPSARASAVPGVALRSGHRIAVPLLRGADRHLQLLHQLPEGPALHARAAGVARGAAPGEHEVSPRRRVAHHRLLRRRDALAGVHLLHRRTFLRERHPALRPGASRAGHLRARPMSCSWGWCASSLGWVSVVALMLSFFFMSIMYPTHFALAIRGLGERTKLASSWMVTAIVGGALMPMLMGWLADHYSMRVGFLMPMACFAGIMAYGFGWRRLYRRDREPTSSNVSP